MSFLPLIGCFGAWLKQSQVEVLDITQRQLGYHVGCLVGTIESYEQDRAVPSKTMAERIAHILHYPDAGQFVVFARQGRTECRQRILRPAGGRNSHYDCATPAHAADQWPVAINESFRDNRHCWGLGVKANRAAFLVRALLDGAYALVLEPKHVHGVVLSGESAITAPPIFYLSVEIEQIDGDNDPQLVLRLKNCTIIIRWCSTPAALTSMLQYSESLRAVRIPFHTSPGTFSPMLLLPRGRIALDCLEMKMSSLFSLMAIP